MTSSNPQRWTDDRLYALTASTQGLLNATQANTESIGQILEQQKATDRKLEFMIEGQLAMQTLHGQLAEQKRAIDYLLSKGGGQL